MQRVLDEIEELKMRVRALETEVVLLKKTGVFMSESKPVFDSARPSFGQPMFGGQEKSAGMFGQPMFGGQEKNTGMFGQPKFGGQEKNTGMFGQPMFGGQEKSTGLFG